MYGVCRVTNDEEESHDDDLTINRLPIDDPVTHDALAEDEFLKRRNHMNINRIVAAAAVLVMGTKSEEVIGKNSRMVRVRVIDGNLEFKGMQPRSFGVIQSACPSYGKLNKSQTVTQV